MDGWIGHTIGNLYLFVLLCLFEYFFLHASTMHGCIGFVSGIPGALVISSLEPDIARPSMKK